MDLQDFLLRARVLKLYRQAVRTARRAPPDSRAQSSVMKGFLNEAPLIIKKKLYIALPEKKWGFAAELKQVIRQEMESNRDCKDKQKIRFLISEGTERLKGLAEMLGMQGHC